jgi:hypothetical protein
LDKIYKDRVRKMRLNPDAKEPEPRALVDSEDEKFISGWKVKWRDWQYLPQQDVKAGLWIAYPMKLEGWCLYSSYPGGCGPFIPGNVFDCGRRDWQTLPSLLCDESDLRQFKAECLEKLKELIWTVGEPPYDPYAQEQQLYPIFSSPMVY